MKICSISATNFRTLENFRIELRRNYCAISGQNNAGKSAIVRIIQHFFDSRDDEPFFVRANRGVSYAKDRTQWSQSDNLTICIDVELDRYSDSEVFFVVETYSSNPIVGDIANVSLTHSFSKDGNKLTCLVNGEEIDGQKASEILKKFRSASNLVVHNSTNPTRNIYYLASGHIEVMETYFSAEDRRKIAEAEKGLQTRVKKAAKQHKDELDKLLGKLNEKYQVELSSLENGRSSKYPLEIKLTDKSVDVPLNDWGSGTQNRTKILISVLEAVRMRSSVTAEDRSTPVFLVEEPESFLHPSAQAEFGQVLNGLAEELEIQIIATTHSPYMLNQNDSSANYLLERKIFRNLPRDTFLKDTSGHEWMLPFAQNLGIVPSEIESWRSVFATHSGKVILVEGDIDHKYFDHFKRNYPNIYGIPEDVEIVPYGGCGSLKNTSILQFMIKRFGRVFITFDLDSKSEVEPSLKSIGLNIESDYLPIGAQGTGNDCLEGLIPAKIKQAVYSEQYALVTAMGSSDGKARKSAKNKLKNFFFEELEKGNFEGSDFVEFKKMFNTISKAFR